MSLVRITFCAETARGYGASSCPRKYGMNWFIPALVSRRPDSGGATSDEDRTRVCPRSSKKRRKASRISAPCTRGSLAVRFVRSVPTAQVVLALVHRAAPFLHRGGHKLAQIEDAAARLTRQGGRRGALRLPAGPAGRRDGGRGAEPDAERDPEQPTDHGRGARPPLPAAFENPLRTPAPKLMTFINGLLAASSTRPVSFSTRPTIWVALSSITSTRSISRFVFSTEVFTSRSSGIVSCRMASMVIFVLSSTRNVLSSTKHRNRTKSTHPTASTIRAMSPPVRARTVIRGLLGSVASVVERLAYSTPSPGSSGAGPVPGVQSRTSAPMSEGS